jgi:hypothetical protein
MQRDSFSFLNKRPKWKNANAALKHPNIKCSIEKSTKGMS